MSSKPESFILNTDYATLKNDDNGTVTVTFPGSATVSAGGVRSFTAEIKIGGKGASTRSRVASSKDGNRYFASSAVSFTRNGTIPGPFTVPYTLSASMSRTIADTVTVSAFVLNPYSSELTCASGDETFTFKVNTFVPPFA